MITNYPITNTIENAPNRFWAIALLASVAVFVAYTIHVYLCLRQIPGPFFASISNVPRLYWVLTGHAQETHIALHKRYGHLVRMGPDMVSVGDPREISKKYGITGKYKKVCALNVVKSEHLLTIDSLSSIR